MANVNLYWWGSIVILLLLVIIIGCGYWMIINPSFWSDHVFYPSLKDNETDKKSKHDPIQIGGVIATIGGFLVLLGFRDWFKTGIFNSDVKRKEDPISSYVSYR